MRGDLGGMGTPCAAMDRVPRPKAFSPLGLREGVYSHCDAPITTRAQWTRPTDPRPGNSVLFHLYTVDLRDELPGFGPGSGLGSAFGSGLGSGPSLGSGGPRARSLDIFAQDLSEEDILDWQQDVQDIVKQGDEDRASRFGTQPRTVAYVTGQSPTGRKVGLTIPYRPSFYVRMPPDVTQEDFTDALRSVAFMLHMEHKGNISATFEMHPKFYGYEPDPANPLKRASHVFALVQCVNQKVARDAARRLQWGVRVGLRGSSPRRVMFSVHEYRIDPVSLFLLQYHLVPCGWYLVREADVVRVPDRRRTMLVDEQYFVASGFHLRPLKGTDAVTGVTDASIAPLCIASLDCEMYSDVPERMPMAHRRRDKVIVVGLVFAFAGGGGGGGGSLGSRATTPHWQGSAGSPGSGSGSDSDSDSDADADAVPDAIPDCPPSPAPPAPPPAPLLQEYEEFERRVFVLADHCEPIPGVIVHLFSDEMEMLAAVRRELFVHKMVDVVLGHNSTKFDIKYMAQRVLRFAPKDHRSFLRFGALPSEVVELKSKPLTSPAMGANTLWLLNGVGFAYLDTLLLCKAAHKLREYSLKFVADVFLKDQDMNKFDMPYGLIAAAISGGPEDVMKLAAYCVQDCVVPLRLARRWDSVKEQAVQAKIVNTLMATNVKVGQQQRVLNSLMKMAREIFNMVMTGVADYPAGPKGGGGGDGDGEEQEQESAVGGFVLDNVQGLHDKPVVVLDFASLYPSIQRKFNLCWSTMFGPGDGVRIPAARLEAWAAKGLHIREFQLDTKSGVPKFYYFVQNVEGVFPQQLADLLAARRRFKGAMAAAPKGSAAYQNANSAQAATKIVMNSGYGTANARRGLMPCPAVGSTTCFMGRLLNQEADRFCRDTFGTETLYGDTDSIMVYFPEPEEVRTGTRKARLAYAMAMGTRAEEAINKMFNSDVLKTECEKVYYPFLSSGKKTYAGLKFAPGEVEDTDDNLSFPCGSKDSKGIRNVRRDVPLFCRAMADAMLDALFYDRSEDKFWDIVHTYTERVCLQDLPLEQYTITREIKVGYLGQEVVGPHTAVSFAREYKVRDSGYVEGDRVPYVIVQEVDAQRGVKPEWMRPTVGGVDGEGTGLDMDPGDDSDGDGDGEGEGEGGDDEGGGGGGGYGARGRKGVAAGETLKRKPIPVKGGANLAVHARHTDEVVADPDNNHLDVVYYVEKGICSVLKQLMPHEVKAQEELVNYAKRVQAHTTNVRLTALRKGMDKFLVSRGAGAGTGTGIGTGTGTGTGVHADVATTTALASYLPTLSHKKPVTVKHMVRTLDGSGQVIAIPSKTAAAKARAKAAAAKKKVASGKPKVDSMDMQKRLEIK